MGNSAMRKLLLGLVLLLPVQAFAAVAPASGTQEAHIDNGSGSCVVSITINSGDTVIVNIASGTSGAAITSVVDSGGSTYSALKAKTDTGIYYSWTYGVVSATASSSVTVTMAASAACNVSVSRYTGVSSFGNTGSNSGGFGTGASVSVTLGTANNYIVCGFASDNTGAQSSVVGTQMEVNYASASGAQRGTTSYNTSASTGSLSCSFTGASSFFFSATAVELVGSAPPAASPRRCTLLGVC